MRHLRAPVIAGVVVGAMILAACTPGQGVPAETSPGEPAATNGPSPSASGVDWASFAGQTLTYVYFTDGPDEQATRELIAKFEQETGAKVDLQILPYGDLEASLQARLSAGDAPEVARLTDINPFRDQLVDLTEHFGAGYKDEFLPGPVGSVLGANGEMLAVPSDLTMNGPFVNVDQFSKADVALPSTDQPWTWDQMIADAEKVQAANGTAFALALDFSGHRVSTILSQFGTTLIGSDGKVALDAAKATKAIELLADLMAADKLSRDFWLQAGTKYKGANEIFLAGDAPVYLSGNWQVAGFAKNAPFTWAAVPNPCAERCGGFPGGKFMGAFQGSKNPVLGAAFVQWMNRPENQTAFAQQSLFLPTRRNLAEAGIAYPERSDDMNTFLADLVKTPEDTYATVASPAFGIAATALRDEIAKVVAGQEDVATAVEAIRKATEDALAEVGN